MKKPISHHGLRGLIFHDHLPPVEIRKKKSRRDELGKFARGGRVAAEKALPPNHQLGMKVPEGGSMCANCRFLVSPTTCGNAGFVKWNGGPKLPHPAHEYCCDNYQIGRRKRADGGSVDDGMSDEDKAAMMPETYANPVAKDIIGGAATLPKRAMQAAANYQPGDISTYDPGPILEAATLPMGTGAIAGVPVRAGETVLGAGPIRAYHGSPHDFDAFDISKIGTGEGAQAYGHGLYFADNEAVAKSYRDTLEGKGFKIPEDVAALPDEQRQAILRAANAHGAHPDPMEAAKRAQWASPELRSQPLESIADKVARSRPPSGKMYEVQINADPEHFLDWDKPLSEQSPEIQRAVVGKSHPDELRARARALLKDNPNSGEAQWLIDQADFAEEKLKNSPANLGAQYKGPDVSEALRNKGIPGIKYLDQGSRTAGEGSRNYVVFNDKLIDILKKYGITGAAATGMASEIMNQGKQHFASGGAVQHMADGGIPSFEDTQPVNSGPPPFEATQPVAPDMGGATAALRGAEQGATFGFSDELSGLNAAGPHWLHRVPMVGAMAQPMVGAARLAKQYFTGTDPEATAEYEKARDEARAQDELAKQQHPYLHMAGELAGSIPAMAVLPGGEALQGASLATRAVKGAQLGAEYGGLSGLGEGKDAGERAMGAAQGIVSGIVGGAAAPLVGAGAGVIADRFVNPAVGAVRGMINPEAEASRRLAAALQKDQELISAGKAEGMSPQEWARARAAGEPVTLADLGSSNTQALLRSSANTSPEGRAILEKAIGDRFAGQTERVANEVRGLVAGGANAGKTAEELVADYNKARVPAYKQAYQQGDKEIVSPAIERLMGSPTFEQAMKNAVSTGKDRAIAEGYGAFNPGVTVENGMIKFTKTNPKGVPQYPNLQYWDAVKKELDSMANVARRQGDTSSVAGNLATTLRNELDQQVPSYANARGIAAQYFGENNALEAGQKLAGKKVDPQQITNIMAKMKPDERELFREGYASDWANRVISNISDTRDITKAMFNSPNERARALAVFGPAGMAKMQTRMTLETIMDGARKAMGNSTTARQLIEAGLAGGTLEGYLSGWDPTRMAEGAAGAAGARKFLGSELASGARHLVGKVDSRTARLVAELLTSNDPAKLRQGMAMAQKNQRIADGLKNIANRISLAGQQQVAPSAVGSIAGRLQGPMTAGANNEQQ